MKAQLTQHLKDALSLRGYKIHDGHRVVGKSGVEHVFDIVAEADGGGMHAYVLAEELDELHLLACYLKQLDTGLPITIVCSSEPSARCRKLAEDYSLKIIVPGPSGIPSPNFTGAFSASLR
jgi:hypothetical protein